MRVSTRLAVSAVAGVVAALALAGPASAHAERTIGPIDLEMGFRDEPAYVGLPNAVFIELSTGGHPIADLGDDLEVTLGFGDQTSEPMTFEPIEERGQYQAPFVPSQPGPYTFSLSGTVDGTKVNLSLTSGPQTFDEVQDPASSTFPAVDLPTTAQLADRAEREATRTQDDLAAARDAATHADGAASSARTIGYAGVGMGALGVIVGIVALATRRNA
jgi:hypothetical protein